MPATQLCDRRDSAAPAHAITRYLFAFFAGEDEPEGEQVYLGLSRPDDPLVFDDLAGNRPVLRSHLGTGGVRDPFLLRRADGAGFVLLATDLHIAALSSATPWQDCQRFGSRSIVIWESADLVTWSAPRLAEVAPPSAGCAWAPEAVWDPARGEYLVFWASTLFPPDDAERLTPQHHRMMCAATSDFVSFGEPTVWADPGHPVIDSTLVRSDGSWYRFTKDERSPDSSAPTSRFITCEASEDLRSTSWELVADGIGMGGERGPGIDRGEGPAVVVTPAGTWVLYIDEFGGRGYVPFVADGPRADGWGIPDHYQMPSRARHGSVLAITEDEAAALTHAYGVSAPSSRKVNDA